MRLPEAIISKSEINAAVSDVVRRLAPDVEHIRFEIAQDWSGDWAVFFRVVLSDEASTPPRLRDVARKVESDLAERLDFAGLGLLPYFNFRSVSEQAVLREEAWA